ncbi:hypothetical protein [uncultured Pseudodesulfovibrio sp.]|uniref:hypothetical protein n=1 Tax=uncultured Pseudodesulfovibrio sp. TaxID=2035858 RepID=UPI0029C8A22B|nr:hypothetical protein [uncultured Pseudodesulfovibrio sp.]
MRIPGHASEQYRKTSDLAEKQPVRKQVQPQATTKTTSFGFRLGKFGLDYQQQETTFDPSLSREVRERNQKARAFEAEAEVESLRAKIGTDGAHYRERHTETVSTERPPQSRIKTALTAYAKSSAQILPLPGAMLASVI